MKVTVVDCSVSGHRETYYKQFAQTLLSMGCETSLIAPNASELPDAISFEPIASLPLRPLPVGKPIKKRLVVLINAAILLFNLYVLRKQLKRFKPNLVFFACLDDMLPTLTPVWLLNKLVPYQWSGLLVQSALGSYKTAFPDIRRALRSPYCVAVGVLNEYSVESLLPFQKQILLFPDFADLSAPCVNYELLHLIRARGAGKKIVSLLGSIHPRKGIDLFLKSSTLLDQDTYLFLMAGNPSLSAQQIEELRAFESSHPNCIFALEKIPSEACFNALVLVSDVVFAAYSCFSGSSNMLTKAAAFGKPIVVSRGFCMGKRVEKYRLGAVVDQHDDVACAVAISRLCQETTPDLTGLIQYTTDHRVSRLVTCFTQLLKYQS